jgi:hypothetical protein
MEIYILVNKVQGYPERVLNVQLTLEAAKEEQARFEAANSLNSVMIVVREIQHENTGTCPLCRGYGD